MKPYMAFWHELLVHSLRMRLHHRTSRDRSRRRMAHHAPISFLLQLRQKLLLDSLWSAMRLRCASTFSNSSSWVWADHLICFLLSGYVLAQHSSWRGQPLLENQEVSMAQNARTRVTTTPKRSRTPLVKMPLVICVVFSQFRQIDSEMLLLLIACEHAHGPVKCFNKSVRHSE